MCPQVWGSRLSAGGEGHLPLSALVAFHTVCCHVWGLSTMALCRGLWHCLVRGHGGPAGPVPWQAQAMCPVRTLPQLWRLTGPGATCRVECAGPRTMGGLCLWGRQADLPPASERLCCSLAVEGHRLASMDKAGLTCPWQTWEGAGGSRHAGAASPVTRGTLGLRGRLWTCPHILAS